MPSPAPLWITEAEVVSMMDLGQAIEALEKGLLTEARGDAANMMKTHVAWGNGATLHAIGAVYPKDGLAGTKTWTHTEGGATPLLILFDSENGSLRAIIEAFALGQMRTASAAGVATKWLAGNGADDFAIIGTGKQAIAQVAAVLAVRPIKRVRVFGRNEERREQFAARVRKEFELDVTPARNIAEAVKGAAVITVVTRATEPVLSAEMIDRGVHVNAVGAILPSRAEMAADVLARCSRLVVDSVAQAQRLSKELMEFFGPPDQEGWKQVTSLAELVAARKSRAADDDITLFKSLGMGISDLALGMELYQTARELGLGRELSHPERVPPRLRIGRINQ
jgi:ornithine cyclodeaminase/alanine dehydrogenase-like protein (mu-crystallin family)